jgi:hypothetical protein
VSASWLDRVARATTSDGEESPGVDRSSPVTRRVALARGALILATIAAGGRLALPDRVRAAESACPQGTLGGCLTSSASRFFRALKGCGGQNLRYGSFRMACYEQQHRNWRVARKDCRTSCPPPRRKTSKPKRVPYPGPQPTPAAMDQCADCQRVDPSNGCCFGGSEPGQLCACATPCLPGDPFCPDGHIPCATYLC